VSLVAECSSDPFEELVKLEESGVGSLVGIPERDVDLWEQLRRNPAVTDLSEDISYLRYLRLKLQDSIERRSGDARGVLYSEVMRGVGVELRRRGVGVDLVEPVSSAVMAVLDEVLPVLELSRDDVKVLRGITADIGKLAKQYKEITDGISVRVEFDSRVFDQLMRVLFEIVPQQYMLEIAARMEGSLGGVVLGE